MTDLDWYLNQKWFRCDFATFCKYVLKKGSGFFNVSLSDCLQWSIKFPMNLAAAHSFAIHVFSNSRCKYHKMFVKMKLKSLPLFSTYFSLNFLSWFLSNKYDEGISFSFYFAIQNIGMK